jgi:uncharacterized alpha-E superfamily protein
MLSRVADALYWTARYLERAENTTRLLLVTEELTTQMRAFNDKLAQAEWADLLTVFPGERVMPRGGRRGDAVALDHIAAYYAGTDNAYSVAFSLRKARENARAVREALSVEVFVALNETYRALEEQVRRPFTDLPEARTALSATHSGLFAIAGAVEHTLSRDEGWSFLELGRALERVYRMAAILRAKLPGLMTPVAETELQHSQWRSLLRGLGTLENYRRLHGARMEPRSILEFLLFDPHAPRSLRFGTGAVQACLEALAGDRGVTPPGRLVGRVHSQLSYGDVAALTREEALVPFLDGALADLVKAHDAIDTLYFAT